MWFTPYKGYYEPPEPPAGEADRPTTANFTLRKARQAKPATDGRPAVPARPAETSLSVWRMRLTTEAALRANPLHKCPSDPKDRLPDDTLFLTTTAGAVRALRNGSGEPLRLDVVPDDADGTRPGHAGILCPDKPGKLTKAMSTALQGLFCNPWPPPGGFPGQSRSTLARTVRAGRTVFGALASLLRVGSGQ